MHKPHRPAPNPSPGPPGWLVRTHSPDAVPLVLRGVPTLFLTEDLRLIPFLGSVTHSWGLARGLQLPETKMGVQ